MTTFLVVRHLPIKAMLTSISNKRTKKPDEWLLRLMYRWDQYSNLDKEPTTLYTIWLQKSTKLS